MFWVLRRKVLLCLFVSCPDDYVRSHRSSPDSYLPSEQLRQQQQYLASPVGWEAVRHDFADWLHPNLSYLERSVELSWSRDQLSYLERDQLIQLSILERSVDLSWDKLTSWFILRDQLIQTWQQPSSRQLQPQPSCWSESGSPPSTTGPSDCSTDTQQASSSLPLSWCLQTNSLGSLFNVIWYNMH